MSDHLPSTFPLDRQCDPILFFIKLLQWNIYISPPDEIDNEISKEEEKGDININKYFEVGYGYTEWSKESETDFQMYERSYIRIDIHTIVQELDLVYLKENLFQIANCIWGNNSFQFSKLLRYYLMNGKHSKDFSKPLEIYYLPQYLTFHLDFSAQTSIDKIKKGLKVENTEVLGSYITKSIPEVINLQSIFVLRVSEGSEISANNNSLISSNGVSNKQDLTTSVKEKKSKAYTSSMKQSNETCQRQYAGKTFILILFV